MKGYLLNVTWNKTYRLTKIKVLSIEGQNVRYKYHNLKGYASLTFSTRLSHIEII